MCERSQGSYIMERRLLYAWVLTHRNLANFSPIRNQATVDAPWVCLYEKHACGFLCRKRRSICAYTKYTHIRRGALRCSFRLDGQMREPLCVKRATRYRLSRFFRLYGSSEPLTLTLIIHHISCPKSLSGGRKKMIVP